MSDESDAVAPTTTNLLPHRSPLSTTTLWLQRTLLVVLVLAHLSVPFLFAIGQSGELIRDVTVAGQLSLWLISLTLLGLSWSGFVSVLIGGGLHFGVWWVIYGEARHLHVFHSLAIPATVLSVALVGLRLWGWRGVWNVETGAISPWQVSIRQLLLVTTGMAIAFAGANWLRQIPALETDRVFYWIVLTADGCGTAALCLTAVWACGTSGSAVWKTGALLLIAIALAACQVFAFRMEGFWHLPAISSLTYASLLAGTLAIWRLCGWQLNRVAEAKRLTFRR